MVTMCIYNEYNQAEVEGQRKWIKNVIAQTCLGEGEETAGPYYCKILMFIRQFIDLLRTFVFVVFTFA